MEPENNCFLSESKSVVLFVSSIDLSQRMCVKLFQHMPYAECTIHFWQKGLPAAEMLRHLDSMGVRDVANAHPEFATHGINLRRVFVDEVVYGNKLMENGQPWML